MPEEGEEEEDNDSAFIDFTCSNTYQLDVHYLNTRARRLTDVEAGWTPISGRSVISGVAYYKFRQIAFKTHLLNNLCSQ